LEILIIFYISWDTHSPISSYACDSNQPVLTVTYIKSVSAFCTCYDLSQFCLSDRHPIPYEMLKEKYINGYWNAIATTSYEPTM